MVVFVLMVFDKVFMCYFLMLSQFFDVFKNVFTKIALGFVLIY